ncbi:MAG: glycosyltransferase [Elusimicrobiota bacterium]
MTVPRILIVIPVYNESARLPRLLSGIIGLPSSDVHELKFLLVDDGSSPDEYAKTLDLLRESGLGGRISCLRREINGGKGSALKAGFERGLSSGCEYVGFLDADGSTPASELLRAMEYFLALKGTPLAAVIGSRVQLLGRDVSRNALRHYLGRIFATLVSLHFGVKIYDSQCGMKLFRASVLKPYLDRPTDMRWVWDTQLILSMLGAGESVHEMPIDWHEIAGSKISVLRDPFLMAWHLLSFRSPQGRGS